MNKILLFVLFGIFVLPACAEIRAPVSDEVPLILLMGQSNMSGRGTPMPEWENNMAQIFDGQWQIAKNPVARDDGAAHGPAALFTDLYTRRFGALGLVPCSRGGSSMADWQPGGLLFEDCLDLARNAGGNVVAVLYYQGEADAENMDTASQWARGFSRMVAAIREEFGDEIPVVFAQISAPPTEEGANLIYWDIVREQQASIMLPRVSMIDTTDLSFGYIHFGNQQYDEIGRRFFEALLQILPANR